MYHYFFDSPLSQARFAKNLGRVESRLIDLGIKGKITRLTPLHDLATCVREALAAGADTLVAVGNDQLLSRIVSFLKAHPHVTVGAIPFGEGTMRIAQNCGIPAGLPACDTLAARRTERLDAGVLNSNELFISSAEVTALPCRFECDRKFTVQESPAMHAAVLNLIAFSGACAPANPRDGLFTICLTPPPSASFFRATQTANAHSQFLVRAVRITPSGGDDTVTIDGFRRVRAPLTLEIMPQHLSFVVGKERKF
jgi:diacylglycerol kinase family enzyme